MSTLLIGGTTCSAKNVQSYHRNRVLKSRENIFKPKCNKSFKKKLKKYKLRKDGQEDPDIIDVSRTLITSLRIKSPNNQHLGCIKVNEEIKPHNYLTKMVRLKKNTAVVESAPTNTPKTNNEVKYENISLSPSSDYERKQTDAFKLLMDSRNKSIGSNSPGKEKSDEDSDVQEKLEKKELKVKRVLSLKRMAEAKGSLKKLEIEEYRDEIVKIKMNERAKRLKRVLVGVDKKNLKKGVTKHNGEKFVEKTVSPIEEVQVNKTVGILSVEKPTLKTFDLFQDLKENPVKKISKEDEEFLNKLSPSLKKKENMLCYFQRVSRDSEAPQGDSEVIKVKLKTNNLMKKKKNKIATKIHKKANPNPNTNQQLQSKSDNSGMKSSADIHGDKEAIPNNSNCTLQYHDNSRSKRSTKRPVKYADDFHLTSSDDELHIFTPKKKKKSKPESLINSKDKNSEEIKREHLIFSEKVDKVEQRKIRDVQKIPKNHDDRKAEYPKLKLKQSILLKKATKLAPIFVVKPQLDAAALEAKQKFLQSGVPSQLKKTSLQQRYTLATDEFQTVVHVQNLCNTNNSIIKNSHLNLFDDSLFDVDETLLLRPKENVFKKLLHFPLLQDHTMPQDIFQRNVDLILQDIKKSYPRFPVYRTYHLLKGKSKGEFKDCIYPDLDNSVEIFNNMVDVNNIHPDKLNWTDKYKPRTEKQMIGNFESVKELKKWLVTWTENNAKSKNNKGDRSDSSDFYDSDANSRDTMRNENNLLIITGKVGSGKTLSVYAVAAELAIKVIEVNASTKRTGKIMLQDLQEATQSHKVDRGTGSTDCPLKSQESSTNGNGLKAMKKRGRKKKVKDNSETKPTLTSTQVTDLTLSQENVRTGMSLILIDDADIVFDQDDGFCSAISQLVQSSKRPVILVTSSLTCPHLQKFLQMAKIIKMRPFLPRMLGTWIDIMCLVDNNMCRPGLGAKILDLFNGDIRKAINYLQFYMTSQKYICKEDVSGISQEVSKLNTDDENSCMSWAEKDEWGDKNTGSSNANDIACNYFVTRELQLLQTSCPLNIFCMWWNLPKTLNCALKCSDKDFEKSCEKSDKGKEIKKLHTIAGVLDFISITDYWENSNLNEELNILSRPWHSYERDSVMDSENFASYNRSDERIKDISCELLTKSISVAQRLFDTEDKTNVCNPSLSIRRERDKIVSRHRILTTYLNPSAVMDRRALSLDYWPACRSICRIEKTKTDNHIKRNNRFCHYLKSLNVLCKNDYFDNLCESLRLNNKV